MSTESTISSFQSKFVKVIISDEVEDQGSTFVYNFYTIDQSTNEEGFEDPFLTGITYSTLELARTFPRDELVMWEAFYKGELAMEGSMATRDQVIPRYVLLKWSEAVTGWSPTSNWVTEDTTTDGDDPDRLEADTGSDYGYASLAREYTSWSDIYSESSDDWVSFSEAAEATPLHGTFGASHLGHASSFAPQYDATHDYGMGDDEFSGNRKMAESMNYEESFQNASFTGLNFQPTGFDKDIYNILSGYATIQIAIDETNETSSQASTDGDPGDLYDAASKFIEALGLGEMNLELKKLMVRALSDYQSMGFYENAGKDIRAFSNLANFVDFNGSINKSLAINIIKRAAESFENIFSKQLNATIRNKAFQITNLNAYQSSDAQRGAGFVTGGYDVSTADVVAVEGEDMSIFQLAPVDIFESDVNENVWPIGYVIEKYRELDDGTLKSYGRIMVGSRLSNSLIDPNILYGHRYLYKIRTVFITQFFAYNVVDESVEYDDPDSIEGFTDSFVARCLMATRGCPEIIIDTFDKTAPEPPDILDFSFNPDLGGMVVSWESPIYNEGDLATFQIYRRNNLYEPYTLIGELKWVNDDEIYYRYDKVPHNIIENTDIVKTFFIDKDFGSTDNKGVYAVCATDKMGFVSGYSCQYYVTYDVLRQRTSAVNLSKKGAPRPYPNIYMNQDILEQDLGNMSVLKTTDFDFFIDTLKDSYHSNLKIYFNPDVYGIAGATPGRSDYEEDGTARDYEGTVVNILDTPHLHTRF